MFKQQHDKVLERAENHIFSTGVEDACTKIAQANMKFGLAKIHFVQKSMGLDADATFISSPDETITRNVSRWEQGISYGGKVCWGNGKEKLMILDVKPNCCGMLVGGLNKLPDPKEIIRNTAELENKETYIDGVKVKWDFYKGNHFIDFFEVKNYGSLNLPKYAVILHAGCPEFKSDNERSMGLYWNKSDIVQQMMSEVQTPFGSMHILEGKQVQEYYDSYKKAEKFAKKRRELAFNEIMGGKSIIVNKTHQGLTHLNEIRLGCQNIKLKRDIFPVSIRADLPSYLFRGKMNLSKDKIEDLGFKERSLELGVYTRLRKANLMPHGGGYMFTDSLSVNNIFEIKGRRFFDIEMINGMGKKIVSDMRELQFAYRDREVVQKTIDLDMGEPICELIPEYTIKI